MSSTPASASAASAPATKAEARQIPDDAPLEVGLVRFEGMVRPTKDGYDVRGAVFDHEELASALRSVEAGRREPEWFLGAKIRVTAELASVGSEQAPSSGELPAQGRAGLWLDVRTVRGVEVVAEPVQIDGTLTRSKGFFALGGYLVTQEDVRWSLVALNGRYESKRVRLWGQPRTVKCEPNAQCLIEGSLPIFDVGRATILE